MVRPVGLEEVKNLWGTIPSMVEMQSEGGAAGSVHGALQTGSLTTTFTASQGLLLMIPNMFKIAGELTPTVFHITARTLATQALSIFGDHSDVMAAAPPAGAARLGLGAGGAGLRADRAGGDAGARVPFLHFFDGFRTSHEVPKIETLTEDDMRAMIDDQLVAAHRARAMSPDRPVLRGTAQNPDVFFQAREAVQPLPHRLPGPHAEGDGQVRQGRGPRYHLFDYLGAPDAERVIVMMGSGCEAAQETVDYLDKQGEQVGVLKVRLYRPFECSRFVETLPATVKSIAVLDRTKEPGAHGRAAVPGCHHGAGRRHGGRHRKLKTMPKVFGGRYGLSSKEFTPAMVKAVFDNLAARSRRTISPSASPTTSPTPACRSTPSFPPSRTTSSARCSTGWARTAPWARTRTRSRSSAKTRTITRRAISFMTRRNRAA